MPVLAVSVNAPLASLVVVSSTCPVVCADTVAPATGCAPDMSSDWTVPATVIVAGAVVGPGMPRHEKSYMVDGASSIACASAGASGMTIRESGTARALLLHAAAAAAVRSKQGVRTM